MTIQLLLKMLREKLARNYSVWWLYHHSVADEHSIMNIAHMPLVKRYLKKAKLGTICDLGSGPTRYTKWLAKRSHRVICLDISERMLRNTKYRCSSFDNVSYVLAEAQHLPFRDNSLDTILSLEVLEHIEDDRLALSEMKRILKPGGRLIMSVPVPPGYVDNRSINPYGHKREGYTLDQISQLFCEVGLFMKSYCPAIFVFTRIVVKLVNMLWKLRIPPPVFLVIPCLFDSAVRRWAPKVGDLILEATKNER